MEVRRAKEKNLRKLKNETEVWKFINRKRGKRQWIENNIKEESWRRHFMELLGGAETRTVEGRDQTEEKSTGGQGVQEEDRITEEEIIRAVRKLKLKKACGGDGIPMEAWKFAGSGVKKGFTMLLEQIWEEGDIPTDWKMSIIVPLCKRGDKEQVENY